MAVHQKIKCLLLEYNATELKMIVLLRKTLSEGLGFLVFCPLNKKLKDISLRTLRLCGESNLLSVKVDAFTGHRQWNSHYKFPVHQIHLAYRHAYPVHNAVIDIEHTGGFHRRT